MKTLLGIDLGSSSIKAALLNAESGRAVGGAQSPADVELSINAPQQGWAEQEPQLWWHHVLKCCAKLKAAHADAWHAVAGIGIAYQMHGLVAMDKMGEVLRSAIIWCDSRAVETGRRAAQRIGTDICLERLLNLPGNFTAAKLAWVKENEPEVYRRVHRIMLPGDWLAYRLTGEITTTISGLSEGIFWDFSENQISELVLEAFDLERDALARFVPSIGIQGELTPEAARALDLAPGVPVAYRAGDQPNNAFSLGAMEPGDIAASGGTSGVLYGIIDHERHDPLSRVNIFAHVNHDPPERKRYGVLLCLNATGILLGWMRRQFGGNLSYSDLAAEAASVTPGADDLFILPFGNGAERMLENRNIGGSLHGLDFNIHGQRHLVRAALEGIAFALRYGFDLLKQFEIPPGAVRAGQSGLFQSPLFCQLIAMLSGRPVQLYRTDGALGAARGAGLGMGLYRSFDETFAALECADTISGDDRLAPRYSKQYQRWKELLDAEIERFERAQGRAI